MSTEAARQPSADCILDQTLNILQRFMSTEQQQRFTFKNLTFVTYNMRIWSYNCFVPFVSFLFLGLASYGVIGLVLNSWALDKGSFHGIWPLNEKCGIVVLMVAQVILIFVMLIGLGGFLCRSVVIWYIPGFLLLGIGVTLIAFGGVSIRESMKNFRHDILSAFRKVNGSQADEYLQWISGVQWEHDCCGIISYKDFLQFDFPSLQFQSVPASCCSRNLRIPKPNCGVGILVPEKSVQEVEAVVMSKGCGEAMSRIQGGILQKLGTEMLVVGFLSVALAIFIYIGIFKIVAAEYAQLAEAEETGGEEVGDGASQTTISSSTAANPSANTAAAAGTARNPAHRRIFRTRRHGGGESIVSFAVDLENNNLNSGGPSTASHGHHLAGGRGQGGQGRGKGKNRTHCTRQGQTLRFVKSKGGQVSKCQARRAEIPKPATFHHGPKTSREKLEMLLHPRGNHSILSTTTYPSTQNFMTYFRQHQAGPSRSTDSDTNVPSSAPRTQPTLTHYSSLPHVHPPNTAVPTPSSVDPKSKAMAELKQRFPPGVAPPMGRNLSKSVPPPATSQTQHHHYYRIPSRVTVVATPPLADPQPIIVNPPVFVEGKFPSVIEAAESSLDTIQEEGESGRSTMVQQSPQASERISIFEVFSEALGASLEAAAKEATGGGGGGQENVEDCQGFGGNLERSEHEMTPGPGCLVIREDMDEVSLDLGNKNKIEVEPMDALVYFQV